MSKKSDFREFNKDSKRKRIRILQMKDNPFPVPKGIEGTIQLIVDAGTIHVKWDNGRSLGVITGVDK